MSEPKKTSFLEKYGPRLLSQGYSIVPIPKGDKYPAGPELKDWEKLKATPKLLTGWIGRYKAGGVGVHTRDTPLVDIDVLDEEVSAHMVAYVQEWYGPAPVRIGRAPKTGLLFRAETPFRKVQSRFFVDEWDTKHKVEILGEGQQFVAYAQHPDTKKPYTWPEGPPPAAADLPVLTEEMARKIVAEFERFVTARGWKPHAKGITSLPSVAGRKFDTEDVFATDIDRIRDLSDDEIAAKLMLVEGGDDYDTWSQIGMALYHQFEGSEEGLELWHQWSQQWHNYKPEALDNRWATFEIEGKGRQPITAKIILKLAKKAEQEIATERFQAIKDRLAAAADNATLTEVCDEVKTIQFPPLQRTEIVSLVQQAYKRFTKTALPIGVARSMTAYQNPAIKDAPYWLKDVIHVANGNVMWNRKRRFAYSMQAFDAAHNRYMLTPQERLEGKASPETRASEFALNSVQIESVANTIYMPGEDETFTYNGQPVVNTYSDHLVPEMPERLRRSDVEAVEIVKRHITNYGTESDQRVLIDVMAYVVQNPGKRVNFGILLQGTEKDGKTVFARLMSAVLGHDNVKSVPAQALEEKYTSWAEGAQCLFVEEIKLQGHNRFDVLNKVKPLLTNVTVSVRRMNTDVYEAPNTATYFLLTNYVDALPVDQNDSRYFIMFSRFQSQEALHAFMAKNPGYYAKLHDAIDHKAGALRHWLLNHEISPEFNPNGRAPKSQGKSEMVAYNLSEEEETVLEIVNSAPDLDLSTTLLNSEKLTEAMSDLGSTAPYGKALKTLLVKMGWRYLDRVFIGGRSGKAYRFWSQDPARFKGRDGRVNTQAIRKYLDTDL